MTNTNQHHWRHVDGINCLMTKLYKNHVKSPIIPASSLGIRTIAELLKVPRVSRRFQVPPIGFLCPREDQIKWDEFLTWIKHHRLKWRKPGTQSATYNFWSCFVKTSACSLHMRWIITETVLSLGCVARKLEVFFDLNGWCNSSLWLQSFQHPNNLQAHLDQGMSTKSSSRATHLINIFQLKVPCCVGTMGQPVVAAKVTC